MKHVVRTLAELGPDMTLSPERFVAASLVADGVPLGDLVRERRDRVVPRAAGLVLDTTHARDGVVDVASAMRARPTSRSAKKRVVPGDLLVSRLRPYLRQIALAPAALLATGPEGCACSTEFYVLCPRNGESLAYLVPFLLGEETQAVLAAGQEGGHHPRVPRDTLFGLKVPHAVLRDQARRSAFVERALRDYYEARARLEGALATSAGSREEVRDRRRRGAR